MKRGRKIATGKYKTREELIQSVLEWAARGYYSVERIGGFCGVAGSTVLKILTKNRRDRTEGKG